MPTLKSSPSLNAGGTNVRKTGRQTESQRLRETLEPRHESFAGKDSDILVCTGLVGGKTSHVTLGAQSHLGLILCSTVH